MCETDLFYLYGGSAPPNSCAAEVSPSSRPHTTAAAPSPVSLLSPQSLASIKCKSSKRISLVTKRPKSFEREPFPTNPIIGWRFPD